MAGGLTSRPALAADNHTAVATNSDTTVSDTTHDRRICPHPLVALPAIRFSCRSMKAG
jgi:hypothetical protein